MPTARIALIGDYSPTAIAHRAIPQGLAHAGAAIKCEVRWTRVRTDAIHDAARTLKAFSAAWIVPASPYASMDGAPAALRSPARFVQATLASQS